MDSNIQISLLPKKDIQVKLYGVSNRVPLSNQRPAYKKFEEFDDDEEDDDDE